MKTDLIFLILVAMQVAMAQQPTPSTLQKSMSAYLGLHTSPAKNQTAAQQQQDETACYESAKQDSGFDPRAEHTGQQQSPTAAPAQPGPGSDPLATFAKQLPGPPGGSAQPASGSDPLATFAKQLPGPPGGSAQPALGSDPLAAFAKQLPPPPGGPAQPATPEAQGATTKGIAAGDEGTATTGAQPQQKAQAGADMQQKTDGFKKRFSACMEARNYVVK